MNCSSKGMRTLPTVCILLLAVTAFAGCTSDGGLDVDSEPGSGGGRISNSPPEFRSITMTSDTADNDGSSVVIVTMEMFDANGEVEFSEADMEMALSGARNEVFTGKMPTENFLRTSEPSLYDLNGWKFWNSGEQLDGLVTGKFRYVIPEGTPPGELYFTPTVDQTVEGGGDGATGLLGGSSSSDAEDPAPESADQPAVLQVQNPRHAVINPWPVDSNGTEHVGEAWGNWSAAPGDENVVAANYMQIVNSGQDPNAMFIVDYSGTAFVGNEHRGEIPINLNGAPNIEYAWFEGPPGAVPADGDFVFQPGNAEASLTVQFTDLDNVGYFSYRIVKVPDFLPPDTYGATFTITEV